MFLSDTSAYAATARGTSSIPSELGQLCLARLGLPFFLFDSREQLIYANSHAQKHIQRTNTSLSQLQEPSHSSTTSTTDATASTSHDMQIIATDQSESATSKLSLPLAAASIFQSWAVDPVDFIAHSLNIAPKANATPTPILGTLIADCRTARAKATPDAREGSSYVDLNSVDDEIAFEPYLRMQDETQQRRWWKVNLSSFPNPSQPSEVFYAVLLLERVLERPSTHNATQLEFGNPNSASDGSVASNLAKPPPTSRPVEPPPDVPDEISGLVVPLVDPENPGIALEFYKAAVESMPQILFTTGRDGIVTYLNPQWYNYTGWDPNKPDASLWTTIFHPNDVEQAVYAYGEAVRAGRDIQLQYRIRSKDDTWRWFIARGRCIRDEADEGKISGFVCTLTDGEDVIDSRREALNARQYISTVLQSSAIALVVVDKRGTITMLDGALGQLEMLGVTKENTLNQPLAKVWPESECIRQVDIILNGSESSRETSDREFHAVIGDSHFRYRISSIFQVDDLSEQKEKEFAGLAIVCTDVTAAVRAQQALAQSREEQAALVASEEAAREASRLKTVFVTSLSHEIRTPISGIIGISELLLGDPQLTDKQRNLVNKQLVAGESLLRLVSMVLDLGKVEARKLEIEQTPFYLSDLMDGLDIFDAMADVKNLYFRRAVEASSCSEGALLGDKMRLLQILSNFVSNAIKFTHQGGLRLTVAAVERGTMCDVTFTLVDTGVGIASETLPQLFKPFHQASVSTARKYGGSGLGLTIAKSLAELMNGTIHFQSKEGEGTTVVLEIPLAKATEATTPVVGRPPARSLSALGQTYRFDRSSVRILVVEDNALLQEVYAALIRKMGFANLTLADDGQHAVDVVAAEPPFSLCLMDCELPRLSGPQAVAIIRSDPRPEVRNMHIVALTANAIAGDEERFLSLGFQRYLSKPVRSALLESTILSCLEEHFAASSPSPAL